LGPARQWPQTGFTIFAWINAVDSVIEVMVEGAKSDFTAGYFQFTWVGDGSIRGRIHQTYNGTYIGRTSSAGDVSTNTLTPCAFTWSGATPSSSIRLYVRGTRVDATDDNLGFFTAPYSGSDPQLLMGGNTIVGWNGTIAEVGIWKAALGVSEIIALGRGIS